MHSLPVSANIESLTGIRLGVVADPRLIRDYPNDVANAVVRKVIQANSFAQQLGTKVFYVIQNDESLPIARYIDAMGSLVVYNRPMEYVALVVPQEDIAKVDAVLVFRSPQFDFEYSPASDETEITEVKVKLSPGTFPTMQEKPYSVKHNGMKPKKDPYVAFHVPKDLLVQKIPDTYKQQMMEAKPEFPENYTLNGNG